MTEQHIKLVAFEDVGIKSSSRVKISHSQARFFEREGVRNFSHVYAPSYPHIEDAYKKAGKKIFRLDEKDIPKEPEVVREEITVQDEEDFNVDAEVVDTQPSEELSDSQWRDMSWPKLRSAAKNYTDEPVKSKEQAEEIMAKAEEDGKL